MRLVFAPRHSTRREIEDVRKVWPRWWVPDRIMIAVGLFAWSSLSVGAVLARMIRHATGGAVAIEFALCLSVAVTAGLAFGTVVAPAVDAYAQHLNVSIDLGQAVLAGLKAAGAPQ